MRHFILAAAVLACAAITPAAAEGIQDEGARAYPVRYADLDPAQREDAVALLSRLRFAAARACSVNDVHRPSPAARRAMDQCRAQALETAVANLDIPEVTRLYQASLR